MPNVPVDYERIVQEVYEALLQPGDIAVDIGAHRGRHTLPLARIVGSCGRVFAVEPLPPCRADLRGTIERLEPQLAGCVTLLSPALFDRKGKSEFVVAEACPEFSGLKEVPFPKETAVHRIRVDVETFDNVFIDLPSLQYVKIDAEGAELQILHGAVRCLIKHRPVVAFEFGTISNRRYGTVPEDIAGFLGDLGYEIFAITGEKLSECEFCVRAAKRDVWDYVAVPSENCQMCDIVERALNRARVNWLAVDAQLKHARDHVNAGAVVPPLKSTPIFFRALLRSCAAVFLLAARMITIPQRLFNNALLSSLQQLTKDLERCEHDIHVRDRTICELVNRVANLEKRLQRPEKLDRQNPTQLDVPVRGTQLDMN